MENAGWPFRLPRRVLVALYAPWAGLVFLPSLVTATLIGFVLTSLFLLARSPHAFRVGYFWSKVLVAANLSHVTLTGLSRVRRGQSYIIVCNHESHFDVPSLWSRFPLPFRFVMKKELRHVPFLGWGSTLLGNVIIDRKDRESAMASLRAARPMLDRGVSLLFFAEGTRSPDGRLQAFKKGAFVIALESGLPILPVSISGTYRVLPGKRHSLLPGHARITVHEPVMTTGLDAGDLETLVEQVRTVIATGLTSFERGES